jgi:hypothetical protein
MNNLSDTEKIKKRHIRDLKSGKKKTIMESVVEKYGWTVDEMEFLKPYINSKKPLSISNTNVHSNIFTKGEAYQILEKYVENETSLKNYKSKVNALMDLMNVENEEYSLIFHDLDALISSIIKKYKDPTSYFSAMLFLLSKSQKLLDLKLVPNNSFDIIKSKFDEYKSKNIVKDINNRQEDIGYEKVYKGIFKTEKQFSKEQYASMKHLITVMYTHALYDSEGVIHINPRNYFDAIILIESDDKLNEDENFYNITTGRLIINKYKTSGIYNSYNVILTKDVQKVIMDSLKKKRTYLIEKESGGKFAKNTLSEVFKSIFGYTINTVRKSIESYEINVNKSDRVHLASVSRHSVMTQEVSYLARTT